MTSAAPVAPSVAGRSDPLENAGYLMMVLYFFLLYSRVAEMIAPSARFPMMLGISVYAVTALTGGIQRALATLPGKLLMTLTGLMMLSVATSIWISASLTVVTDVWFKAFPFYFVIVGLATSLERCLGLIRWFVRGVSVLCLVALVRGDNVLGRLIVDNSRFGDPNDLALICLMAFPLGFLLILRSKKMPGKLVGVVALMPIALALSKTGSRGGMLSLMAMLLYIFWKVSLPGKMKMLVAVVLLAMVAGATLPREVMLRYVSMFSDEADDGSKEAEASKNSGEDRMTLLKNSLIITLKYPLLGVGPGNYPVAENDLAKEAGALKGQWHDTHNMYTQISSEVGIPAAICYISVIVLSLRYLKRIQQLRNHPDREALAQIGFWVRVALIGFCAGGFFLSVGYVDIMPLLAGIAAALMNLAYPAGQNRNLAPAIAGRFGTPRINSRQLSPSV